MFDVLVLFFATMFQLHSIQYREILEHDVNEGAIMTYEDNFSLLYQHCRGANRGNSKESGMSGNYISFEVITLRILHRPGSK